MLFTGLSFISVVFSFVFLAPLLLFGDMERWQKTWYLIGLGTYFLNSLFIGSGWLLAIAIILMVVASIQPICQRFPIRL